MKTQLGLAVIVGVIQALRYFFKSGGGFPLCASIQKIKLCLSCICIPIKQNLPGLLQFTGF